MEIRVDLQLFHVYGGADGAKGTQAPKGFERTSKGLTEFFELSVHTQICDKQ